MRLELYLQETARLAERQGRLLDQAALQIRSGESLNELEQNGVLHALQVLVENAIGKAKHLLKSRECAIPVSAYDAFKALAEIGELPKDQLSQWNAIIGLRNRIVHDYLNIDFDLVKQLLVQGRYKHIVQFLLNTQQPSN